MKPSGGTDLAFSQVSRRFQGKPGIPAEWTWIDRHLEMFEASSSIGHKLLGKGAMKNPGFFFKNKAEANSFFAVE